MPQEELEFGEPEFLGWLLLTRLKNQSDDQISRSKFLKLCCIADRRLIESQGYEVGLPRYWYMYGELANEHEFSGRFYNAPHAIGWDGQQYIPKDLSFESFDLSEAGQEVIPEAVNWTVRNFGRESVEQIKQHQYEEYAENEFIHQYSELRWLLNTIDLGKQDRLAKYEVGGESNEEYLKRQLDEMMAVYPGDEDRYGEVKSVYFRWDDTVRLMIDQSMEYSRIAEFLDAFISVLSKTVLRFVYSQNISGERLSDWKRDAKKEREEFTKTLGSMRSKLLKRRSRSTELDSVSDAYSQAVNEKIKNISHQE
ncbi:hypothetical protein [Halobaculum sp. MBLA0143]|uniref:hypothetical protein n=1 Tax=Halobaculum sp. MBLA0143 TaxID=3079933 RepID=UPI0035233813